MFADVASVASASVIKFQTFCIDATETAENIAPGIGDV